MKQIPKSLSSILASGLTESGFQMIVSHNKSYAVTNCTIKSNKFKMEQLVMLDTVYPVLANITKIITGFFEQNIVALVTDQGGISLDLQTNQITYFKVPENTFAIIASNNRRFYSLQTNGDQQVMLTPQTISELNEAVISDKQVNLCYKDKSITISNTECEFQADLLSSGFVWNNIIYLLSTNDEILLFDDNIQLGVSLSVRIMPGVYLFAGSISLFDFLLI